jgi:hypothetical protein
VDRPIEINVEGSRADLKIQKIETDSVKSEKEFSSSKKVRKTVEVSAIPSVEVKSSPIKLNPDFNLSNRVENALKKKYSGIDFKVGPPQAEIKIDLPKLEVKQAKG